MDEEYGIYEGFAGVYDLFMDNIPYGEWHRYLRELLLEYGVSGGRLLELACGTGTMTALLAQDGYEMTGVDLSEDMLSVAREKCPEGVMLLHQDIRHLELAGDFRGIVCVCDGMNYLLSVGDLRQVFGRVFRFLQEDGVFIFDMKTEYFYREILGEQMIADNREDASLLWENSYDSERRMNEYFLTVYRPADLEQGLFVRYDEYHRQRAYPADEVRRLLRDAGFSCRAVYQAFTREMAVEESERLYFIASKG